MGNCVRTLILMLSFNTRSLNNSFPFVDLPDEVTYQVFSKLSKPDILNVRLTCRLFSQLASSEECSLTVNTYPSLTVCLDRSLHWTVTRPPSDGNSDILPASRHQRTHSNPVEFFQRSYLVEGQFTVKLLNIDEEQVIVFNVAKLRANRLDLILDFDCKDVHLPALGLLIRQLNDNFHVKRVTFYLNNNPKDVASIVSGIIADLKATKFVFP